MFRVPGCIVNAAVCKKASLQAQGRNPEPPELQPGSRLSFLAGLSIELHRFLLDYNCYDRTWSRRHFISFKKAALSRILSLSSLMT